MSSASPRPLARRRLPQLTRLSLSVSPAESTELSRSFAQQGLKLRIRRPESRCVRRSTMRAREGELLADSRSATATRTATRARHRLRLHQRRRSRLLGARATRRSPRRLLGGRRLLSPRPRSKVSAFSHRRNASGLRATPRQVLSAPDRARGCRRELPWGQGRRAPSRTAVPFLALPPSALRRRTRLMPRSSPTADRSARRPARTALTRTRTALLSPHRPTPTPALSLRLERTPLRTTPSLLPRTHTLRLALARTTRCARTRRRPSSHRCGTTSGLPSRPRQPRPPARPARPRQHRPRRRAPTHRATLTRTRTTTSRTRASRRRRSAAARARRRRRPSRPCARPTRPPLPPHRRPRARARPRRARLRAQRRRGRAASRCCSARGATPRSSTATRARPCFSEGFRVPGRKERERGTALGR